MSSEKEMETAPASPKGSPTLPFSFERDDQEPVATALNDTDSTGAPGPAQDAQAAAPPLVFNELQGRTEEGQQQEQNEHASLGNQNLSLIVHGNQSLESPRDTFDPLHQLNQNAFAALNTLSGPAFRAQGSAYMVSRGLAANAVVNDPTHQVGGGVLIPVLDEEELLNADPKLLEMLAEINCLNTNFTLSLAGDRHPEVEGNA